MWADSGELTLVAVPLRIGNQFSGDVEVGGADLLCSPEEICVGVYCGHARSRAVAVVAFT